MAGSDGIILTPMAQQNLGTTASPTFAKINLPTGAAGTVGVGTLVAGVATISTTAVTANSIILTTLRVIGGLIGELSITTITPATSFVVTSIIPGGVATQVGDTSTFFWMIVN